LDARPELIQCAKCRKTSPVDTLIKERPIAGVELRFPVSQVYFHCPHCEHEVHSYFTSPRLDRWKEEIQHAAEEIKALKDVRYNSKDEQAAEFKQCRKALIKAQARHRTEHDRLQASMEEIIQKHARRIDLAVLGSWLVRHPDPKFHGKCRLTDNLCSLI
jgi:chromosome segregation ATPase